MGMATDEESPQDPQVSLDLSSEGSRQRQVQSSSADEERVSDDIDRIASYLTETRSASSDRTKGLATELSQRRAEMVSKADSSKVLASNMGGHARHLPKSPHVTGLQPTRLQTNPVLAERFHIFCRNLDQILDSFQARIECKKQARH